MDFEKTIFFASNSYYNVGLEQARVRDLSGAAVSLKKCLRMDKYHTDARNLLGLIYYEMGETANALVQWVISMNLQPEENRAALYLDEMRGKPGRLEVYSQTLKKYNQALEYAKNGNPDFAILQLNRIVDENTHFVKAHLLLALLYMQREDYVKAGKFLLRIQKIDKNNAKAQYYMSLVKAKTGRAEIENRRQKQAYSHRKMEDDDVIIPPTYRENTGWQMIFNILVGLALGAAFVFFIIMPANITALNGKHNQEMLRFYQQISDGSFEQEQLESTISQLEEEKAALEQQVAEKEGERAAQIQAYSQLITILNYLQREEITNAANVYVTLDQSVLAEDTVFTEAIAQVRPQLAQTAAGLYLQSARAQREAGDLDAALANYLASQDLEDQGAQVWLEIAQTYLEKEDREAALPWLERVIAAEAADSELSVQARELRGN
ncbi:MAG: tetratricopeptide repeat protein [bacterium]|nr:tetratricopeptide repeat protein [bacterium]